MTQSTLIASGTSSARSSSFTVAAGANATVSLAAAQSVPVQVTIPIRLVQDDDYLTVGSLSRDNPLQVVSGPGEFVVERDDISGLGVDVEVLLDA